MRSHLENTVSSIYLMCRPCPSPLNPVVSMQAYRFRLTPNTVPTPLLRKSFFATWGRIPRPAKVSIEGDELLVCPVGKGSGTLHVFWPHHLLGVIVESTDSLLPRPNPYLLVKELGRGALGRLSKKIADWQVLGFQPPDDLAQSILDVSRRFSKAATSDETNTDVEKEFVEILERLENIILEASRHFTDQSLAWRVRAGEKIPVCFGVGIREPMIETLYEFGLYAGCLHEAFHAVLPMPTWRELEPEPGIFQWEQLEKCLVNPQRFGFRVVLGPLLDFDRSSLPTWLLTDMKRPGFFEERAARFVLTIMEKYDYLADVWILASKTNSHCIPEFSVGRGLDLIQWLGRQIRQRSIEHSLVVGVDQPWGEYGLDRTPDLELFQVAERLANSPEIDSLLMELNIGLDTQSTFPRDPISVASMIDTWSFLGKNLYVSFSVPSVSDADPLDGLLAEEFQWSEGLQQLWAEAMLTTLLTKRSVCGIFWTPLQDADPDSWEDTKTLAVPPQAFRGLIDDQRVLKLAFKQFAAFREAWLK